MWVLDSMVVKTDLGDFVSSSPTHVQWRCAVVILSPPCVVRSPSSISPPVHPAADRDVEYFWGVYSLAMHSSYIYHGPVWLPTPLTIGGMVSPPVSS